MTTVNCPTCETANPAGQKFCGACATPLPLTCPSCGSVVTATQKFCGECATPLQTAQIAGLPRGYDAPPLSASAAAREVTPQEQRRLVTVLFCDLVGFTPLSEQLDAEELRVIQSAYFGKMAEQVERYGGTVEKYAGDAVLALFGVPVAHEDDAERAVLCALEMHDAVKPIAASFQARWTVGPAIRVGVNTGEVISGTWDASGRQEVAVTGAAVNTAARIQAAAKPGEVLVGAETMQLTGRRIAYGGRQDLVLKGKAGTVPGYSALGLREEVGERWEDAERATPLVGRERELAQILDVWMRVQGGEGGLVAIVGEPGMGKSRLAAEVIARVSTPSTRIIRGRCLSYDQEISLWLLADLIRGVFGLREAESQEGVGARLRVAIPAILVRADREAQDEAIDVLGEVLGLPPAGSLSLVRVRRSGGPPSFEVCGDFLLHCPVKCPLC